MICPRDGFPLRIDRAQHASGSCLVYVCNECSGAFVEGSTVKELRRRLNLGHTARDDVLSSEPGKYACPECMSWLQPSRDQDVELDLCVECHGIWFDRDELMRLEKRVKKAATRSVEPPRRATRAAKVVPAREVAPARGPTAAPPGIRVPDRPDPPPPTDPKPVRQGFELTWLDYLLWLFRGRPRRRRPGYHYDPLAGFYFFDPGDEPSANVGV